MLSSPQDVVAKRRVEGECSQRRFNDQEWGCFGTSDRLQFGYDHPAYAGPAVFWRYVARSQLPQPRHNGAHSDQSFVDQGSNPYLTISIRHGCFDSCISDWKRCPGFNDVRRVVPTRGLSDGCSMNFEVSSRILRSQPLNDNAHSAADRG